MELILKSIIAFATTNIDDLFILMLFLGNAAYPVRDVVIGQYLGVGTLIVISVIGSLAGLLVDTAYIGLLGLLPIYFGGKALISHFKKTDVGTAATENISRKKSSLLTVAAVTISNGGDNIGIYIPLFATLTLGAKLVMILIFFIMIAFWCIAGSYLSRHPVIAKVIEKYGHIVTPIVLILLGIYIMFESGSFQLVS